MTDDYLKNYQLPPSIKKNYDFRNRPEASLREK
jgi:hypothetical protein